MSDLVKRLRAQYDCSNQREFADRIEKLEAQLAAADELADMHNANRSIEEIDAALTTYREARK